MTNTLTHLTTSATVRSGLGIFALGLVAVVVLSACGGGDPVKVPTSTTSTTLKTYVTSSSSATPTADLSAGTVRYFIQGPSFSEDGTTTFVTQDSNHAVTAISTHSVTGTYAVQEFMGHADLAQGRWTKGTVTLGGAALSSPLTGTDSTAVHYMITRDFVTFPGDGTYTCASNTRSTGLTFTGLADSSSVLPYDTQLVGAAVPYAKITVGGVTATVSLTGVSAAVGGLPEGDYLNRTLTFAAPNAGPVYLDFYSPGEEGAAFVLGRDTNPANITLGMAFRRAMGGGARYKGMTSVVCTP